VYTKSNALDGTYYKSVESLTQIFPFVDIAGAASLKMMLAVLVEAGRYSFP
jgi:hypothetical protein